MLFCLFGGGTAWGYDARRRTRAMGTRPSAFSSISAVSLSAISTICTINMSKWYKSTKSLCVSVLHLELAVALLGVCAWVVKILLY